MGKDEPVVGGQAVIEGVMMRRGDRIATAVRKPDGITVRKETFPSITKRIPFLGWPFMRGAVSLFETMYIGTRSLIYSANEAADEDDEENVELSTWHIFIAVGGSLLFAIGLFVLLPYMATTFIGIQEKSDPIIFNLVDGIIKLIILIAYILLIGQMSDIRRVFQYHGAEHKSVHAYEHRKTLTPQEAQRYPTAHVRCGTSFLLIVILVGVVIFSFIPVIVSAAYPAIDTVNPFMRYSILFLARIAMLPVIAGISYEWLQFTPRLSKKSILYTLALPGLFVQRLTTREPTSDQLEVAIEAIKAVLPQDAAKAKKDS